MNRFNIKRFGHLALWTLREARQEMVTYGVVLTALYAAIIFLFLWGSKGENLDGQQMSMFLAMGFCASVYSFASFFFHTRMVANMKAKRQAIPFLSLPASPLEKWLVRVIYCCVALQAIAFVTLLVADGLGSLFALYLGHDYWMGTTHEIWRSVILEFHINTTVNGVSYESPWFFSFTIQLFLMSLIVCVSTLFRHPLLSSIGAMAVVVVFVMVFFRASNAVGMSGTALDVFYALVSIALLALSVWPLRLSYKGFTHREIVTHKWMNL